MNNIKSYLNILKNRAFLYKKFKNNCLRLSQKYNNTRTRIISNKRYKIIILGSLAGVTFLILLTILTIVSPEIKVGFLKPQEVNLNASMVNSMEEYPQLQFDNKHRIYIKETNKEKFTKPCASTNNANPASYPTSMPTSYNSDSCSSYKFNKEDLAEGTNHIEARRAVNLFFFSIVSSEAHSTKIYVDRVAPELNIVNHTKDNYLLLEPFKIEVEAENNTKVFNGNTQLGEIKADDTPNEDASKIRKSFDILPADGTNRLEIYIQDKFGNNSQIKKFEFQAFQKPGYTRFECRDMVIPIPGSLQLGYSGLKDRQKYDQMESMYLQAGLEYSLQSDIDFIQSEQKTCDDKKVALSFFPLGTEIQCLNCGAVGGYISVTSEANGDTTKLDYVTKSGIKGIWRADNINVFVGDYAGFHVERSFTFQSPNTGSWYSIYIPYTAYDSDKNANKNLEDMAEHLKFVSR